MQRRFEIGGRGDAFGLVPGDPDRNEEMLHAPGVW
jgi:hypothetical protein